MRNERGATAAWLRALQRTASISSKPAHIFPVVIEELAEKFTTNDALISERYSLSFAALSGRANQYARWALAQGVQKGDVVCLDMPNCAEYLAIWIGITRIGGVVALLNTNLIGRSLAHCINSVRPRHVIVGSDIVERLGNALPYLSAVPAFWLHGDNGIAFPRIDDEIQQFPANPPDADERRQVTLNDVALYIYTSGTTGLPKAATVRHYRIMQWSHWFAGLMDTQQNDRMYNCLPLYHSVGGIVATGATLVSGGSVVLREKFSAQRFWDDIVELNCTLFQYIGELCRHLVQSPHHPRETAHRLRLCCGNGLRGDVWHTFKTRFQISQILEFYAATEGNVSLYNVDGTPGSIGRIPTFLRHRSNLELVKFDIDTNAPVRGDSGFCIECETNEAGEALGKIASEPSAPEIRFDGYSNPEDTKRKILRDVFKKGDAWFRTGDLLRMDQSGNFYFVDRIGDTFRWKGENVSTMEVSLALLEFPGVSDAAVYGVVLPGHDGRAGMAALVVKPEFEFSGLLKHLDSRLPRYAHPIFIRLCRTIGTTSTFKYQKTELIDQGYDPRAAGDEPVYFNDMRRRTFIRLDQTAYETIKKGQMRF
jgi:fatty-acyl-CoA synthase